MAENSGLNIFECLQIYEDIHLEKLATLRSVEEGISKEYQQLCQVKIEVREDEETIHGLQENQNMLEIQHSMKTNIKSYMNEQLEKLNLELEENNSRIANMELSLDEEMDGYVESALSFNESVRLDTSVLINPLLQKREKSKQMTMEEDVLRCELKVRQDLEKEVKFLGEKLINLSEELTRIEEETVKHRDTWNKKIADALKMRNDLQDPGNQTEIKNLEEELENVEQESEFLMAALDGVKKELEKKNFRRFVEDYNFLAPKAAASLSDSIPSMPRRFIRNVPSPPSPLVSLDETSSTEESSALETEEDMESRTWPNLREVQKDTQQNPQKLNSFFVNQKFQDSGKVITAKKPFPPIGLLDSQNHHVGSDSISQALLFTRDSAPVASATHKENNKPKDSHANQLKPKVSQFPGNEAGGNLNSEKQEQPTKLPKVIPGVKNSEKVQPDKNIKFKFRKSTLIHYEPENQSTKSDEAGRRDKSQKVRFKTVCEVLRTDPN